jgi:hypothetical protein
VATALLSPLRPRSNSLYLHPHSHDTSLTTDTQPHSPIRSPHRGWRHRLAWSPIGMRRSESRHLLVSFLTGAPVSIVPLTIAGARPLPPQNGNTPLHMAALHGWLDLIDKLLRMGADINAKNSMQLRLGTSVRKLQNRHSLARCSLPPPPHRHITAELARPIPHLPNYAYWEPPPTLRPRHVLPYVHHSAKRPAWQFPSNPPQ